MRALVSALVLVAALSGCAIVPGNRAGIGFFGPIPVIYVPAYQGYYGGRDYGGDYDRRDYYYGRSYERRRYDDEGRRDRRYRDQRDD